MTKKAIVYTSAKLNGSWLLVSIDYALWLHKSDGFKEVTISCISSCNSFNFFTALMRLKNLSLYLTKNKFKKLRNFITSSNNFNSVNLKKNTTSEVANFALEKSDQAYLTIGDLEIQFVRMRLGEKESPLSFITLTYKVVVDYLNYFRRSALKRRSYLEYQVTHIYSGLHILSEALRSDYKSCGSVFQSRLGILAALYKLNRSVAAYEEVVFPKECVAFVGGPDQEYIYGFFSRFMSDRGAYFIETEGMQRPYIKRKLKGRSYARLKISPRGGGLPRVEKEKISDYYKSRIARPWEVFDDIDYLQKTHSSCEDVIKLNGVSVIVYLHSFTDAQYVYGYDGYTDLMDWAFSTISLLNSNEYVSRVIVKSHPGIDPVYHPGDVIANEYLKSRLSTLEKIQWVESHFNVEHINSSGSVVGVTHHGSVAEELVFNKIPVIASTYSPWGEEYKFGFWWDDLKEYESLISSNLITRLAVSKKQTDELYRYAMDKYYSIDVPSYFNSSSTWLDMLKIYGTEKHHEFGENMEQIKCLISRLDPEDKKFHEYIATRLLRINLLRDVCENNDGKSK